MKVSFMPTMCVLASLAAMPAMVAPRHAPLAASERAALLAADHSSLDGLRAGAIADRTALGADELSALVAAQRSSNSTLEQLRAGELSDHDLMVIGIVLLAVIVILIIT